VGEFTYEGELEPLMMFSAHGKVHPRTGEYVNFGAGFSGLGMKGPRPCLNIFRVNSAGKLFKKGQIPLQTYPFCHDFALTDKYAVICIGSIVFGNMLPVMLGTRSIADQVIFDPAIPMQVLVIDLEILKEVRRFETDPGAIVHFGNAFDEGDEIVVDAMYTDNFEVNRTMVDVFNPDRQFNGGAYLRYRLNMKNGELKSERVSDVESEFPTFNVSLTGQRHKACYTACSVDNGTSGFFNAIQRVDYDGNAKVVTLPAGYYGSEPLFVPAVDARQEDDGYILEVVYNAFDHKSELQIYRADDIENQVCNLKLKHHVPHQFHGFFTPEVFPY
jgi:all-trans-8'-apo-beta-carotenal 15,15'-oxygenase